VLIKIIYDSVFILFIVIIFIPFLLLALFSKKWREEFKRRFFLYRVRNKDFVFHSASVGEIVSIKPIVQRFIELYSIDKILIMAETYTGMKYASQKFPDIETTIKPFDVPFLIRLFLKRVKPKVVFIAETELWPNLILSAKKTGSVLILINGRISEKSFRRYRIIKKFINNILQSFDMLCIQNIKSKRNFLELGSDEEKIFITGNLKIDGDREIKYKPDKNLFSGPIITMGSIHKEEVDFLINAYKEVLKAFKKLTWIIVPRYPEICREIEKKHREINFIRYSNLKESHSKNDKNFIILVDSIGILKSLYSISDICFVGGSIVKKGGHNIVEPLLYGKPVIFGPNIENVEDIAEVFIRDGCGFMVRNETEMVDTIKTLLKNTDILKLIEEKSQKTIEKVGGATEKTLRCISKII